MTTSPLSAEPAEPAEAEIELDGTDGVIDLTDRRRVLLHVVFGVDVPATITDVVFGPATSSPD
ncbi:MAG: hypothetical protein OSA99_10710 [Acidimicrobiales bacterium]|nr:hypothetical protein [Acidimicrobiales bacterium]